MTKPLLHPAGLPTAADLAGAALWARLAAVLGDTGERARTRRDAAFAFIVRVVSAALLYLSQIVLARWLGTFEYGIYVFVWTWVLVLGGLSHLGLSTVAMRLRLSE